ncbi:MAG: iron ABC transporter permease [Clostridia bacterium]|nr:iron ABC transporter permease [Clostridia bacterium]
MKEERKAFMSIGIGAMLLLIMAFVSLFLGRYMVSPGMVFQVIYHEITGRTLASVEQNIIWDIRLPRIMLNILVGGGLAAAGVAFQGVFQNRLVSPDILGVSNGAGFGAALGLLLGRLPPFGIAMMAFCGGLLSVGITYAISKIRKGKSTLTLVLSGIVVSSFFGAMISYIKLVADTDSVLPSITYWLMGSFAGASYANVFFCATFIGLGLLVLHLLCWKINILSMGDKEAYALGIDPEKNRMAIVIACTFITATCVMATGIIGWIGMIMPNLCREFISANNKYLLPAATIGGGLFMVVIDLVARISTAAEIPIGILTAVIGAPIFIIVFFKQEGEMN